MRLIRLINSLDLQFKEKEKETMNIEHGTLPKEPWELTKQEILEFVEKNDYRYEEHHILVDEALDSGKNVPKKVLLDYPELIERYHSSMNKK